jgi:hypothetical protein
MLLRTSWREWLIIGSLALIAIFTFQNTAFSQQCRPRSISGTGSGNSYGVFFNGELYSQHSTPRGAVRQMELLMTDAPQAQVVILAYLWGVWQDNQGNDCAPRSVRPPWPIGLVPPPFAFDSVVTIPDSLSMTVPEEFQFSAVLWSEGIAYVCVEAGVIEAKVAEDRSQACAIREGASLGVCNTPQPLPTIGRAEPCPSAF